MFCGPHAIHPKGGSATRAIAGQPMGIASVPNLRDIGGDGTPAGRGGEGAPTAGAAPAAPRCVRRPGGRALGFNIDDDCDTQWTIQRRHSPDAIGAR